MNRADLSLKNADLSDTHEQAIIGLTKESSFSARADRKVAAAAWLLSGRPKPDSPVQEVLITTAQFSIGRHSDNNLCLANTTVSSRHAALVVTGERLYVKDLNSTNGTFVNGRRVEGVEGLCDGDRLQCGTANFVVRRRREWLSQATVNADISHHVQAYAQFDRLLGDPAVDPFFQPIVRLESGQPVGYEVLARSRLAGLETPAAMFQVAEELSSEVALSCLLRREGMRLAQVLRCPSEFYLNTHASEVGNPELFRSLEDLREEFPSSSMVLEIHEAAVTSPVCLARLHEHLKNLGMRLAYDDFGAGQARLLELAEVPPDVLKFDMHLIHDLSSASQERRQMIASLVHIVRTLGATPLAEGVETGEEAAVCSDLGFELAQGFHFGRPAPGPVWFGTPSSPGH